MEMTENSPLEPEKSYTSLQDTDQILTVKELAPDERPRERALKYGISSLSVAELLALILRTGLPNRPITTICRDLMRANDNLLTRLERRSLKELMMIPGLGSVKAQQIEAIMELVRRYVHEEIPRREQFTSSDVIAKYMRHVIGNADHEEIWALFLDRRNCLISKRRITSGTSTASLFDARPILKHALLENAESIVLCHNHPSGNKQPSMQDDNITRALGKAAATMGMRLLDHVIVTIEGHFSYSDNGRL